VICWHIRTGRISQRLCLSHWLYCETNIVTPCNLFGYCSNKNSLVFCLLHIPPFLLDPVFVRSSSLTAAKTVCVAGHGRRKEGGSGRKCYLLTTEGASRLLHLTHALVCMPAGQFRAACHPAVLESVTGRFCNCWAGNRFELSFYCVSSNTATPALSRRTLNCMEAFPFKHTERDTGTAEPAR